MRYRFLCVTCKWSCNSIATRKWVNVLHSKNTPELIRSHTNFKSIALQWKRFFHKSIDSFSRAVLHKFTSAVSEYFRFPSKNEIHRFDANRIGCIWCNLHVFLISLVASRMWLIAPTAILWIRLWIEFETISVTIIALCRLHGSSNAWNKYVKIAVLRM